MRLARGRWEICMSSPVHGDGDRKLMYAPPWIRDQQRPDDPNEANGEDSAVAAHFAHDAGRPVSHSVTDLQQSALERPPEAPGLQMSARDERDELDPEETEEIY